jgi:TatA/E family protein of Tat protein translocase
MPFGLHLPELIIVLVVALLIFGPKKLPEMGSAIGKSIKEFKKGMNELNSPEPKSAVLRSPKDPIEEMREPVMREPVASSFATTEGDVNIERPLHD